ncbi:hypothetical protein FRB95_009932 [Tulasnella sp. JGI-2019a]|nr:hypothetical protein FRB95_009932 [Tulasnella sp. JGI-2019a]
MASKLIVAAAITLNAILWSQSRYATSQQFQSGPSSLYRGSGHQSLGVTELFPRHWDSGVVFSNASLINPDGDVFDESQTCRPLSMHLVKEQCAHVQEYCPGSNTLLSISYLERYFCAKAPVRPAYFVTLVVWLIFLFSFIGITASDFFCPNLNTIAKFFGLSDNVTGVTFLAFGNGSPDVFATYSAMRSNTGSLAIGELLGAASFIVSVVVGSMCIVKPFHVRRGPFLRDVGFFAAAVSLLLLILYDGKIEVWEAASLVALYGCYVFAVVVGTWWSNRKRAQREHEELVRGEFASETPVSSYNDEEPYRDDPRLSRDSLGPTESRKRTQSHPTLPGLEGSQMDRSRRVSSSSILTSPHHANILNHKSSHSALPSFSLIGALEFRSVVNELQKASTTETLTMFDTPNTPSSAGRYIRHVSRTRHSRQSSQQLTVHSRSGTNPHDLEQDPWDAALAGAVPPGSGKSPTTGPGDGVPFPTGNRATTHNPKSSAPDITIIPSTPANLGAYADLPSSPTLSPASSLGELLPRGREPLPPFAIAPAGLHLPRDLASFDGASFAFDQPATETTRREQRKLTRNFLTVILQIFHTLFPTLQNFGSPHKSWVACVVGVVAAPAVFLLTITLPVVITCDDEEVHEQPVRNDRMSITEGRLVDIRTESEDRVNWNAHYSLTPTTTRYRDADAFESDLRTEEEQEEEGESDVSSIVSDIEKEMHGVRFDKSLLAIQCVSGPVFVTAVLFSETKHLWTYMIPIGLSAAYLVSVFAKNGRNPAGRIARSLMGFAVAVVWIMAIADEVVQVLQTFGFIFGLSNAIVGLTIFAVGNSMADLIANLSVAVFAPVMGFSACFGGPMLNILLGVGISGSIVLHQRGQPYYPINFSTTLLVSAIGLLCLLLATMIFVPLNGYWLSKRWGIFLICFYAAVMTVNIVVEIKSE